MFFDQLQHKLEEVVHAQIDERDEDTCKAYAEHAAQWLDSGAGFDLCHAYLMIDHKQWPQLMATISRVSPELANGLDRLADVVSYHRAEFMEEEAKRRAANIRSQRQALAEFNHEMDAARRRA
ncbi:hypothetical protein [Pseudomonas sp. Marseille-QA0892]